VLQGWEHNLRTTNLNDRNSGGFKVGRARDKTKKGGALMVSSYLANRDKHTWSSLRYGHRRISSWGYGMADTVERDNTKGCS